MEETVSINHHCYKMDLWMMKKLRLFFGLLEPLEFQKEGDIHKMTIFVIGGREVWPNDVIKAYKIKISVH